MHWTRDLKDRNTFLETKILELTMDCTRMRVKINELENQLIRLRCKCEGETTEEYCSRTEDVIICGSCQ